MRSDRAASSSWARTRPLLPSSPVLCFRCPVGIGVAIVIVMIELLWDGWRPYSAALGHPNGVEDYHDITRYPNAHRIPGLVLFRGDAPLFFANAELFLSAFSPT